MCDAIFLGKGLFCRVSPDLGYVLFAVCLLFSYLRVSIFVFVFVYLKSMFALMGKHHGLVTLSFFISLQEWFTFSIVFLVWYWRDLSKHCDRVWWLVQIKLLCCIQSICSRAWGTIKRFIWKYLFFCMEWTDWLYIIGTPKSMLSRSCTFNIS